jgi:hypothetical protein
MARTSQRLDRNQSLRVIDAKADGAVSEWVEMKGLG